MAEELLTVIKKYSGNLSDLQKLDEDTKMQIYTTLDQMHAVLEPVPVALARLMFGPASLALVRTAVGCGIFDAFNDTKHGVFLEQITEVAKGDDALLIRLVRNLCGLGILSEISVRTYVASPLALALARGSSLSYTLSHFYNLTIGFAKLHDFLAVNDYKNPTNALLGPWQFATASQKHYFDYLLDKSKEQKDFAEGIKILWDMRGQDWFQFYPVEQRLTVDKQNDVVFVDIGGGIGFDLMGLRQRFPNLKGHLVLEDLPQVIDQVTQLPPSVTALAHDMFTRQPIRGAKCYYLRTVLHDWPDEQVKEILSHIYDAMIEREDSILLINENVMREEEASSFECLSDFTMMTVFAAHERTETQWRALIKESGFVVTGVFYPATVLTPSLSAVFEATPA